MATKRVVKMHVLTTLIDYLLLLQRCLFINIFLATFFVYSSSPLDVIAGVSYHSLQYTSSNTHP